MSDENTVDLQAHEAQKGYAPGQSFRVYAPGEFPLSEVRKGVRKNFGFGGHIRAKIGPFVLEDGALSAAVTPVDQAFLAGTFEFDLLKARLGWCVYIGELKEPDPLAQSEADTVG